MPVGGVESRPHYPGLVADCYARHHVFAADGDGAQAILDLFQKHGSDIKGRITVVYAETAPGGSGYSARLDQLPTHVVHCLPTVLSALQRLGTIMGGIKLGTRIYAAGSETMIGLVVQLAQASGIDPQSVLTEHRVSAEAEVTPSEMSTTD